MDVEGPLVNAHVVVSTECESDDGLPHTLEHLVFLGSEKFPYKGVLDKVLEPLRTGKLNLGSFSLDFISQSVFIDWFQTVKSPTKS